MKREKLRHKRLQLLSQNFTYDDCISPHTQNDGNTEKVKKIITKLQSEYLKSPVVNYRNGALVAIASIAVSLDSSIVEFFPLFFNSVLKCLEDSDSKVRYYSSEALYNIAKAARTNIFHYFDQFFYALCQLFADVDTDVKKISLLFSISFINHTVHLSSIDSSRKSSLNREPSI